MIKWISLTEFRPKLIKYNHKSNEIIQNIIRKYKLKLKIIKSKK